jgi:hypothetical protein
MNEFQHRIPKQEWIFTVVEPPRHFVKVGRQMLRRDPMPLRRARLGADDL